MEEEAVPDFLDDPGLEIDGGDSNNNTTDNDSSSVSSSSSSSHSDDDAGPAFPDFPRLPPEIRHLIWSFAVPHPGCGINFFNVHAFPRDHQDCNRSTSPPWLYLDLRRLSITDSDEEVAQYDPSAWQARAALHATCREARTITAIPPDKLATVVLTRPKKGLYLRAGDGQLRKLTPASELPEAGEPSGMSTAVEPQVRRAVSVHVDDILSLSIENCSFNLPYEETSELLDDNDPFSIGWAFDPQLTPLPRGIPPHRYCFHMARGDRTTLHFVSDATDHIHHMSFGETAPKPASHFVMFDAQTFKHGPRAADVLASAERLYWDRFGDCYVPLPWDPKGPDQVPSYRLTKVAPESNDLRERYLRSALLQSPKRPAGGR